MYCTTPEPLKPGRHIAPRIKTIHESIPGLWRHKTNHGQYLIIPMPKLRPSDVLQREQGYSVSRLCLFGRGRVLRHCLGTLRNGMLRKFARKDKPDTVIRYVSILLITHEGECGFYIRCLDFSRGYGGLLVVCSKFRGLSRNTLENIIDEGVQD